MWLPAIALARPGVEATGLDAVTTPGTPVLVRAKFERRGLGPIQPDIKRAKVRFSVLGRESSDLTDSDGVAEASVTPPTPGVFPFQAKLADESGLPATGRLFVVPRSRPVAVVDIDGTISASSTAKVLVERTPGETFPEAPDVLRALAATHRIVYLTARDDHFDRITRQFLARHAFPEGPVIYNTWGLIKAEERAQLAPGNHAGFKLAVIKRLQGRGLKVALGIGNAETDAEAYEAAGIPSYIHTEVVAAGKSYRFTAYAVLREKLVADGVLEKKKKEEVERGKQENRKGK